jgi:DNA-binding HxlR family transcriptional regulator
MAGATRTYGQKCGLAASLDLLGERWTLLIVRELARGPKRYGDLLNGLDGIGTNLLSTRLKTLESAGVVERVTLPAPAGVPAYDLGERGRSLLPILEDLALWGFYLLDSDLEGVRVRAAWAAMTMEANMSRSDSVPPDGTYAFEVGEESFWLRVSGGESTLRDGTPPSEPDATLNVDLARFLGIAGGARAPSGQDGSVRGDADRLISLLKTFRLPAGSSMVPQPIQSK